MRRMLLVTGIGFLLACGGGEPVPSDEVAEAEVAGAANQPPQVEALAITPEEPTVEDALTANLRVYDPDRDALSIELVWFRNGSVHDDSGRQSLDPGELQRDDQVWVQGVVSDGTHELEVRSEPVVIRNALPSASGIRITPLEPTAADILEAEVHGGDADGDPVQWSYRWLVDGVPVPGAESARLAPGRARRGANVVVEVSGNDGTDDGEWIPSSSVRIANADPKVVSQPVYGLASPGRYAYDVKAEDPDGDSPLRYELGEAPPGMTIDYASGAITWVVPSDAQGAYPIEIRVSDPHGGRATQRYALQVSWQPASDPKSERRRAAGASGDDPEAPPASGSVEEPEDEFADETSEDSDF